MTPEDSSVLHDCWLAYEGDGRVSAGPSRAWLDDAATPLYVELPALDRVILKGTPLFRVLDEEGAIHEASSPLSGRVCRVNDDLVSDSSILREPETWAVWLALQDGARPVATGSPEESTSKGVTPMNREPNVLVVDDEETVCASLERVLTEYGYAVSAVQNGAAALERLRSKPYDMAFVDLKMPGMPGMDLVRELRRSQPTMPVMIVTGFGTPESSSEAAALGVHDFLAKPLSPDTITTAAGSAWETRRRFLEYGTLTASPPLDAKIVTTTEPAPTVSSALPPVTEAPRVPAPLEAAPPEARAESDAMEVAPAPVAAEPAEAAALTEAAGTEPSRAMVAAGLAGGALVSLAYVLFLPFLGVGMLLWVLGEGAYKMVARPRRRQER
ncbi:MAG: response regulator [Acidobacteriota bacterium]